MSKRKNRAPNLPQETLDRARRQASGGDVESSPADEPERPAPVKAAPPVVAAPPVRRVERRETSSPSQRRGGQPERIQFSRKERKDAPPTAAMVEAALASPTKWVTEAQLRSEYSYVLRDLQTMGFLSLILVVVLVALAQFI